MNDVYTRAITSQTEVAQNAARNKRVLAVTKKAMAPLIKRLADTVPDGIYLSVYSWSDCSGEVTLCVTLNKLDGFKDERFMNIMGCAMDAGYEDATTTDFAESRSRLYRFAGPKIDNISMKVEFWARVKDDSPTCLRVAIGTKTVEQVQYALVCE